MANDQKKIIPINYTATEFDSIRRELIQVAERFYPDKFKDFSEASFGAMMVDAVAYIGDQLSFYMDYNINESFLDTSYQYNNILRHGRILGYKHPGPASSYGMVSLFILIPASSTGIGPDERYIPIIKRGTRFNADNGGSYTLMSNVDFADPANQTVVARVDSDTGAPTFYGVKTYGKVVSGVYSTETFNVGEYERFRRIRMSEADVQEIVKVIDSDGNNYYEVDYLSQDLIYRELSNKNFRNDNVPSILKPFVVTRKFVVEKTRHNTYLQFGSGDPAVGSVAASPQSVALDTFGKDYVSSTTFDPTRLNKNENYGIVPVNTTVRVIYRTTSVENANIAAGGINAVSSVLSDFDNRDRLSETTIRDVVRSLEVTNESPILGVSTTPSSNELKRRIFDTFPTQNRAVTRADYESIVYRMAPRYGSIKRCTIQKDPDSLKRNLNLYVLSEDSFGKLTKTNNTIKRNLKTWLDNYRMINDTIDILDAKILNFGINFTVTAMKGTNKYTVLDRCIRFLTIKYSESLHIGEPIYISNIYTDLKKVPGVLDANSVKLISKAGAQYSNVQIDMNKNLSPDGSMLVIPANVVAELKYPDSDIRGKVI